MSTTTPTTYSFNATSPGMDAAALAAWYLATGTDGLELTSPQVSGPDAGGITHVTGTATVLGLACSVEIAADAQGTMLVAQPARPWGLSTAFPGLDRDAQFDDVPVPLLRAVSLRDPILAFSTSALPELRAAVTTLSTWTARNPNAFSDVGFALYGTPDVAGAWGTLESLFDVGAMPLGLARVTFATAATGELLPTLELFVSLTAGLNLGALGISGSLTIEAPIYDTLLPDRVVLTGTTTVLGRALTFTAELPAGDGDIVLTGTLGTGGDALVDSTTAELLPNLTDVSLNAELDLGVTGAAVTADRLAVTFTVTNWTLLSGVAGLDHADFTLVLDDPLGDRATRITVDAGATLLGRSLEITGALPGGPIEGRSTGGAVISLADLITQLGGDSSLAPDPGFQIDEIRVSHPVVSDAWEVLATASGTLASEQGLLSVELDQLRFRLMGPSPVGIALDARLVIASDYSISVSATRSQDGWAFAGQTGPGELIPVGSLITYLQSYDSGFGLPTAIATTTLSNLRVAYDSAGAFTFAGELDLTVEGTAIHATLDVAVTHGATDSAQATASLLVAGHRFGLALDRPDSDGKLPPMIVGSYSPDQATPPADLRALVDALAPPVAEVLPSIGVKDALVAIASPVAPQTTTRYLFGTDLDVTVSLDAGDVGLGVLSDLIGADLGISLTDPRIIVASDPFSGDECDRIRDLVTRSGTTPVPLPPGGVGRARLAVTLGLCGATYALELPIAAPAAAPAPALPPAAGPAPALAPQSLAALETTDTAPASEDDGITGYKVERAFGPVTVHRVGGRYADGAITLSLGVSVVARGLTLGIEGLSVSSPLDAFAPSFDLTGLTIDYTGSTVTVSGGLLKVTDSRGTRYDGEALLGTDAFTVGALGSYTTVDGDPSLFVFALLQRDLGGPAAFYVTGLAAGFGYNRRLTLPSLDDVPTFPLVAMATGTRAQPASPAAALAALGQSIAPAPGEFWFAAGVRFTSFQIVKSFALVTVAFGRATQIGLLGESRLTMPPQPAAGQEPVAYARLAQRVSFEPDRGVLEVAAQLTPDSYILSRDCHLSGGFAFYTWFRDQPDGARAGDFALTLGGYHPHFPKPAHYPTVAPLRFSWRIGDLSLSGRAYFALTPSVVMAGGALSAVWESGSIRAWFNAQADFLLAWKPFHYEASMSVRIGASFTVDLWLTSFTASIEVGVDLELWGPSFGGRAEIDVSLISFTVGFGAGRPSDAKALGWPEFRDSFLPAAGAAWAPTPAPPPGIGPAPRWTGSIVDVRVTAGLQRDLGDTLVVNGFELAITTSTAIPADAARFAHADASGGDAWTPGTGEKPAPVEIGPAWLDAARVASEHVVLVRRLDPATGAVQPAFNFFTNVTTTPELSNLPLATWNVATAQSTGPAALERLRKETGPGGTGSLMPNALVGFTFTGVAHSAGGVLRAQVDELQQTVTDSPSAPTWNPNGLGPAPDATPPEASFATLQSTMTAAQASRSAVLARLGALVPLDPDDRVTTVPGDFDAALGEVPAFLHLGELAPLGNLA